MGGISSSGFDCSGLVKYSYQKAGKSLPRTAADIYKKGKKVKSLLKRGLNVLCTK
ncbi:C40 family peptidase [Brevibacterium sp. PAMC21349]|nr:C40 family peptidase [Brevibacterium sp. PAMC21349]